MKKKRRPDHEELDGCSNQFMRWGCAFPISDSERVSVMSGFVDGQWKATVRILDVEKDEFSEPYLVLASTKKDAYKQLYIEAMNFAETHFGVVKSEEERR